MPEADAFLLVTSYESPLSEEEVRFFKATSTWGRRIFVVLNKHDTVSMDQREHVLAFVSQQLRAFFGDAPPKLFSVSALHGLQAKQSRNDELLEASGIRAFEQQLTDFLLTEKSGQFLTAMCNRVTALLQEYTRSTEVASLLAKTDELANGLRGDALRVPTRSLAKPTAKYSRLHQAGTCEICASVRERIWNFLSKYQHELVVSDETQQDFARRGGFCPFHTWEYEFDRIALWNVQRLPCPSRSPGRGLARRCIDCKIRSTATPERNERPSTFQRRLLTV